MSVVFSRSASNVQKVLKEIPEVSNSIICLELTKSLKEYSYEIQQLWLDIQRSYPEVYRAIQTKHAAYHIINHEAHSMSKLLRQGLLEDSEYEK